MGEAGIIGVGTKMDAVHEANKETHIGPAFRACPALGVSVDQGNVGLHGMPRTASC